MSDKEIRERVRAKFLRDTSGERVDGYLLRDNSDGTVSIAIVENIEEFVLAEVHQARRAAFEEAVAVKAYPPAGKWIGSHWWNAIEAKNAAIRSKMEKTNG